MGQCGLTQGFGKRKKEQTNIMITGLYGAGKNTLVDKLTEMARSEQLFASSIMRSQLNNLIFASWDVGGRAQLRPLYRHFYPTMDAVIFVVDSSESDSSMWEMAKWQLRDVLLEQEVASLPLLVLANKQDLPGALSCQRVQEMLELDQTDAHKRAVQILPLSVTTGEGLPEVIDWLELQLKAKQLQAALVQPVQKAVPPAVTSAYSRMSSALKMAFGQAKSKLSLIG